MFHRNPSTGVSLSPHWNPKVKNYSQTFNTYIFHLGFGGMKTIIQRYQYIEKIIITHINKKKILSMVQKQKPSIANDEKVWIIQIPSVTRTYNCTTYISTATLWSGFYK